MAAVAVLGGELFLFIFGPAYAFASAPGVVEHDQSVLNIMLHPLFLAAYAVSVVLVIEVGPKALLYTAVVFALSLFVSIPRYWRADKMPEVQNKSP